MDVFSRENKEALERSRKRCKELHDESMAIVVKHNTELQTAGQAEKAARLKAEARLIVVEARLRQADGRVDMLLETALNNSRPRWVGGGKGDTRSEGKGKGK